MSSRIRLRDNRILHFDRMEMMGIINVTPDSFYAGSRAESLETAFAKAMEHIEEGALIIDVGGESTRPGAEPVSPEEEAARICPLISKIREASPEVVISADTYRETTARAAIEAGADMINDISGLTFEPELGRAVADSGAAIVLMHTGGRPKTMQDAPAYENVVAEVYSFLQRQIEAAREWGIGEDQIMVDVGIGFGKNDEHNLALLREIDRFNGLGCPQLMAVSRKSMIGRDLSPEERLPGTVALTAYGAMKGVAAARVHDVKENLRAARIVEAVKG